MNTEEKAKAYDEALEQARRFYKAFVSGHNYPAADIKASYKAMFPELRKSEDEKIREAIHIYLDWLDGRKDCAPRGEYSIRDMIAWLEKQGEKKCIDDLTQQEVMDIAVAKCFEHGEQKPADKVEPKFKIGDWVVYNRNDSSREILYVYDIRDGRYYFNDNIHFSWSVKECDEKCHLWTIQDAKDGDVLVDKYGNIGIYQGDKNTVTWNSRCYCGVNKGFYDEGSHEFPCYPATKEQRDTLMKAMADAGWEFDFEKKELKKIDNKEINGEDYGIDGLWHAQRILEKTLGKVDGYQTDDGILDHKAAITAVKKLYKQKPAAWSEKDERMYRKLLDNLKYIAPYCDFRKELLDWFESIKQRMGG